MPVSTDKYQANCEGVWQFNVDAQHSVTLAASGLECRGSNVYNSGSFSLSGHVAAHKI